MLTIVHNNRFTVLVYHILGGSVNRVTNYILEGGCVCSESSARDVLHYRPKCGTKGLD